MISVTLDTSCFQAGSVELEELMNLHDEGKITAQIAPVTIQEMTRDHPMKLRQYVEYLRTLEQIEKPENKEFDKIANKALLIHSPTTDKRVIERIWNNPDEFTKHILKRKNDFTDIDIFALHVLSGADFFVTNDVKGFIRDGKKDVFEKEFKTKIRQLNREFVDELKSSLGLI